MSHINQVVSHLKIAWYALLIVLVLSFFIGSFANSATLSSVSIKLLDGKTDRYDKKIPFITKPGEELPDYRADVLWNDRWHTIGTIRNTSAREWLSYQINDQPSLALVQRVRITEDDAIADDAVDEVSIVDSTAKGSVFEYKFESANSFKAGMDWFASTAIGKTIFGAIGLAIVLVFLSHFPL